MEGEGLFSVGNRGDSRKELRAWRKSVKGQRIGGLRETGHGKRLADGREGDGGENGELLGLKSERLGYRSVEHRRGGGPLEAGTFGSAFSRRGGGENQTAEGLRLRQPAEGL